MKNTTQYPPAILNMLAKKNFSSLNADDQLLVLNCMDEETYSKLHETYLGIYTTETAMAEKLKLRPQTEAKLIAALHNKQRKPNVLHAAMRYKIPAWQAAAAILILFCSFLYFRSGASQHASTTLATINDTVKVVSTQIEKVFVHDTIYLEQKSGKSTAQQKRDTILADNRNIREIASQPNIQFEKLSVLTLNSSEDIKPSGNSLSDDTLVNKFRFVTIN